MPDVILGSVIIVVGAIIYIRCLFKKNTTEETEVINTQIERNNTEIPPSYDETQKSAPPSYND